MNEFALNENVEKLESVFLSILYLKPEERLVAPNISHLSQIKEILNNIFSDITCTEASYSLNTDKIFFGIKINPVMTSTDAMIILTTDDPVNIGKYQIEFDSKLFDIGLTAEELTSFVLFEISSMMSSECINNTRALIDLHILSNDDVIQIRDSVNYSQLIIYALKDTMYKVSSLLFKENNESIMANKLLQTLDITDSLISAREKVINGAFGAGDSVREPKTIILQWMFMVYKDMKHNYTMVSDTLKDAKDFTASRLIKQEIDKTLVAINRIGAEILSESANLSRTLDSTGYGKLLETSLFASLKKSGLRGLEDALYELTIKVKNCEEEDEAIFILRGINTRLSIIEDYIYNTPDLSDNERKKWTLIAMKYRELREELAKKKIGNKKQYGLFFDYSQLDQLDKDSSYY